MSAGAGVEPDHTLDCQLHTDSGPEGLCSGECKGPGPIFPKVLVRRVCWYEVPVPEAHQHNPDDAELWAQQHLGELPTPDHEVYALNPDVTSETYSAQKGP